MIRGGEGMQVPCTLHLKGHKKFIDILMEGVKGQGLKWTDTFSVMQRKTEYTDTSKYIQYFGLQYYIFFDLSGVDKCGSSYRG